MSIFAPVMDTAALHVLVEEFHGKAVVATGRVVGETDRSVASAEAAYTDYTHNTDNNYFDSPPNPPTR